MSKIQVSFTKTVNAGKDLFSCIWLIGCKIFLLSFSLLMAVSCSNSPSNSQLGRTETGNEIHNDSTAKISAMSPDSIVQTADTCCTYRMKNGDNFWDIAATQYGNRHYSYLLCVYDKIEDPDRIAHNTEIMLPAFKTMITSEEFGLSLKINKELNHIVLARENYMKVEKELKKFRDGKSASEKLNLPDSIRQYLDSAAFHIDAAIKGIEQLKTGAIEIPRKMIGQLKLVSDNLKSLSAGHHDGPYGYDIDMVHQNLVQALKNGIAWAANNYK